jgi:hypothetical protein
VQYEKPPIVFDGDVFGAGDVAGFRPRVRLYNYGVVSISLVREFSGPWTEFTALGASLVESADLERQAEELCRRVAARLQPALTGVRQEYLSEDYLAFALHRISYLANDLVVPTWNAAFVYDTPVGIQAALEILEFANSQLLELRYYDQRLDRELTGHLRPTRSAAALRPVAPLALRARSPPRALARHRHQRAFELILFFMGVMP